MFSPALEVILNIAFREAISRGHAYLTLEHLLYALAHDPDGERILAACGVDLPEMRRDLDHYLEALLRKPGALPGAKALEQARASGRFTPVHDAWWAAACKAHGDADGTRALIEVLMMHRHLPHDHVVAGLATALRAGALTADAVALEARHYNDTADGGADDTTADHQSLMSGDRARGEGEIPAVRSLTERRLRAHIPADTRPLPSVEKYDQLLASRRDTPNEGAAP